MNHVKRLRVSFAESIVGELGADARGQIYFQYDAQWLVNGFDLSPDTLQFNDQVQLSPEPQMFDGLHGVFNDSLPDGWGLLLMDQALRVQAGWQVHEITPLDRLAYIGSRAMGALEYEPSMPVTDNSGVVNIAQLAKSADQFLRGETPQVLQQLQIHGGSPGGARPKVTVALSSKSDQCLSGMSLLPKGFQHWIVKFRSKEDPVDIGKSELAYASMAKQAGLDMPSCQLIKVETSSVEDAFFAVRRFDREGDLKLHMLSLSGYVYACHRMPSVDYETVIKATHNISRSMVEAEKAFRLMVFNVLAHNKDDHSKNFAFIRREHSWELSPAFDITFNAGINNQHSTAIAGKGNPRAKDIQKVAQSCGIKNWRTILDEVMEATGQWDSIAESVALSKKEHRKITSALAEIRQRF